MASSCCECPYKWYYDLTIRVSLEVVRCLQRFPNDSMVVDFAIDSKSNTFILVSKRLGSTANTNDTQTFVSKDFEVLVRVSNADSFAEFLLVLLAI